MYAHKLLLYLHLVHGTHISTYMHRSIYWNPFRVSMTISHQWREACASNVQTERLVDVKQQFDNKGEMIFFFKYALHDTIRQLFCKKKTWYQWIHGHSNQNKDTIVKNTLIALTLHQLNLKQSTKKRTKPHTLFWRVYDACIYYNSAC